MKFFAGVLVAASTLIAAPVQADEALAKKYNCLACHQVDKKVLGPAYKEIAKKYKGQADAGAKLADKVKKGGSGVWGPVPMPPNPAMPDAEVKKLVDWILKLG